MPEVMSRPRTLVAAALLGVAVLAPTSATADAALLKGTVSGSPYLATPSTTAVPVIFTKQSAARAKLTSPVGVLVVPRQKAFSAPGGARVRPGNLRLGDRFQFTARVPASVRRAVFTRLGTQTLRVTKRSRTLSNDELTREVNALKAQLATLRGQFLRLAEYTVGEVGKLRTDLEALRGQLLALQGRQNTTSATVDTLVRQVTDLLRLTDTVSALSTTLTGLTGQVTGILGSLTPAQANALLGQVSSIASGLTSVTGQVSTLTSQVNGALTDIGALQTLTGNLQTDLGDVTDTVCGATAGAGLDDAVNTLAVLLDPLTLGVLPTVPRCGA